MDDSSLSVSDIAINCGFVKLSLPNCEGIRIEVPPIQAAVEE